MSDNASGFIFVVLLVVVVVTGMFAAHSAGLHAKRHEALCVHTGCCDIGLGEDDCYEVRLLPEGGEHCKAFEGVGR